MPPRPRRASDDPALLLVPLAPRTPRQRGSAPPTIDLTPTEVTVHEEPTTDQPPASAASARADTEHRSDAVSGGQGRASDRTGVVALPEHSPLGGSAAERVIACPGSVALIEVIRGTGVGEEDPDYRAEGVQAHALAEYCLRFDRNPVEVMLLDPAYPAVTPEMADAVAMYVGYVRERIAAGALRTIEEKVHRPEIHPQMFGTIDAWLEYPLGVEVVDYKNGVGIVVPAAENPQLMYYTVLKIGMDDSRYPDSLPVKLTIVQPNAYGLPPIRSWETTAGFIRNWMRCVMLPAMLRTREDRYLDVGGHCRFCPAKIICPASRELVSTFAAVAPDLAKLLPNQNLRRLNERSIAVKAALKAIAAETERRLLAGVAPEELGAKLVEGKVDRQWKEGAPVADTFGEAAWQLRKLVSPAMAEKLGDKGKLFVKEWAHKPPGRPTVAPLDDAREAIRQQDIVNVFAAYQGST